MKQKGIVFLFIWRRSHGFLSTGHRHFAQRRRELEIRNFPDVTWTFSGIPDPSHTYVKLVLFKGGIAPGNKIGNIIRISAETASFSWPVGSTRRNRGHGQ